MAKTPESERLLSDVTFYFLPSCFTIIWNPNSCSFQWKMKPVSFWRIKMKDSSERAEVCWCFITKTSAFSFQISSDPSIEATLCCEPGKLSQTFINSSQRAMMGPDSLSVSMKDDQYCFSSVSCLSDPTSLSLTSAAGLCSTSVSTVLRAELLETQLSSPTGFPGQQTLSLDVWQKTSQPVFGAFQVLVIRLMANHLWQIWQHHRRTVSYLLIGSDMIHLETVWSLK